MYPAMTFDPENRRWKCICGLMHVTTGATILAILGIIFGILSITGILWMVPICALMWYGVKKEREGFIVPYLVITILLIIGAIVVFVYCIYQLVFGPRVVANRYVAQQFDTETNKTLVFEQRRLYGISHEVILFSVICLGISICLKVYFWYVVFMAFKFIQAKKEATATGTYQPQHAYAAPVTVVYQHNPQPQANYAQSYPAPPAYAQSYSAPPAYAQSYVSQYPKA